MATCNNDYMQKGVASNHFICFEKAAAPQKLVLAAAALPPPPLEIR